MKPAEYQKFFAGKRITVMGLGLLGRGVGDAKFLAECGADLIVTDLKTEEGLAPSIRKLNYFTKTHNLKPITYHLGGHRLGDFRDHDFILKAAGVPLASPYIAEARKNKIPALMSTALFAKLALEQGVKIIGVTGTRGKSTTTQLIYEILQESGRRVWLGGNVKGVSTLALLPKIKAGDLVVLELDSWQLQGFGDLNLPDGQAGISPNIAVFTNFLSDHMNYYHGDMDRYRADKENIFKWQKSGDTAIRGWELKTRVPKSWKIKLPGEHNRKNIACAMKVAEILGVDKKVVKKVVENFIGVSGRLEFLREWRGVKIYNDTTSTTPDALLAALRALGQKKNIILIAGGADKNLDLTELAKNLPKYCREIILLPGTGSEKLKAVSTGRQAQSVKQITQNLKEVKNLREAVGKALTLVKRGDIILFSPGFASFGLFKNEFDRGAKFVKLVNKLKK